MIKRILVVSACLVALIALLVFPAGAAALDYSDYITSVQVDGDSDIVTVVIPASVSYLQVVNYDSGEVLYGGFGASHQFYSPEVPFLNFRWFPFGNPYGARDGLIVENIPVGTQISFTFDLSSRVFNSQEVFCYTWVSYRDSTSKELSYAGVSFQYSGGKKTIDNILNPPDGTAYANYECALGVNNDYSAIPFTAYDTVLTMTISSLYRLQQESGKMNVILKEVEKQLADQGKTLDDVLGEQMETNDKLDDIISGTVDPSAPAGSGTVGDLDDTEAGLRDDAQSGLDQGLEVQQSALDIVLQYASAFACVGWIFNKFADIPFFSGLLYVSMALGIYGTILGVGLSVSRAGSRAGGRSGKGKGG